MNDTVSFGYEEVSPQEKTTRVGEVFSNVAAKYDIMNDAMSEIGRASCRATV